MTAMWFAIIGALLVLMSLIGFAVDRWPISPGLIYLLIGIALGPAGFAVLNVDVVRDASWLHTAFEATVLISLFSVGLKLRVPFSDRIWRLPLKLATISMLVTIAALTVLGISYLHYSLPVALLFGAIMAPTDPVLASDVQVKDPGDKDRVRFGVTAEGGFNDGTAFPFVFLGLGLLGLHDLGPGWSRWLLIDVLWGTCGGLLIGTLCGLAVGKLVLWVRGRRSDPFGLEEFLVLGLIGLSYGLACMVEALGFLAVLAAGIAMRWLEHRKSPNASSIKDESVDSVSAQAMPGHVVASVLTFNERFERIAEVGAVLLLGGLMSNGYFSWIGLIVAVCLLCVIRPVSIFLGTIGTRATLRERYLISWFGVRGVGSLYYLTYAIVAGLQPSEAGDLLPVVLTVIATSIVVHGISCTPLMTVYVRSVYVRRRR